MTGCRSFQLCADVKLLQRFLARATEQRLMAAPARPGTPHLIPTQSDSDALNLCLLTQRPPPTAKQPNFGYLALAEPCVSRRRRAPARFAAHALS